MMLQRFLYLIAGIVLRTNATILRQSCGIYADFEIVLDDLADSGSRIGTLAVNTSRQCVLQCISAPRCASLNFHKASGTCELLERSLENSTTLLAKKEGWVYMTTNTEEVDVGTKCKQKSPCIHGRCADACTSKGYRCVCEEYYYGDRCDKLIQDCTGVYNSGRNNSGIYRVFLGHSGVAMEVYCDMKTNNQRWIVLQRHMNNSVNFTRLWKDYKEGFGNLDGNMWFGLDRFHTLAGPNRRAIARFDMKHRELGSTIYYAMYTTFEVGSEAEKYKLLIGGYSGTAGNSMDSHNQMMFTTSDNDNDKCSHNCANQWPGGWWYNCCHSANLNGEFPVESSNDAKYMDWYRLKNSHGNIVFSEIKIRYH